MTLALAVRKFCLLPFIYLMFLPCLRPPSLCGLHLWAMTCQAYRVHQGPTGTNYPQIDSLLPSGAICCWPSLRNVTIPPVPCLISAARDLGIPPDVVAALDKNKSEDWIKMSLVFMTSPALCGGNKGLPWSHTSWRCKNTCSTSLHVLFTNHWLASICTWIL